MPFLSLYAGQRLFETVARVDEITRTMSLIKYWMTVMGWKGPLLNIRDLVQKGSNDLPPQSGTERLKIPADSIVWIRHKSSKVSSGKEYDCAFCSRDKLATLSVNLDFPELILDHLPPEHDRAIMLINANF
jgi:hypothetical protein